MLTGLVAVAAGLLLVGGASKVSESSKSFHETLNRSYAVQASILVEQSSATGKQLSTLMGNMAAMTRQSLENQLDALVTEASQTAASVTALSPPAPTGTSGAELEAVVDRRGAAVAAIRRAVDGLLGLSMPPEPGVSATSTSVAHPTSPAEAAAALSAAGSQLQAADHMYRAVRRSFLLAPGRAALPPSVWVTDPQLWAPGPLETLVSDLTSSSTLVPVTRVVLLQAMLRTGSGSVPAVSTGTGTGGTTAGGQPGTGGTTVGSGTILPTKALGITVVVSNQGDVAAQGVAVSASVTPSQGGSARAVSDHVTLMPGTSSTVALADLPVTPGQTYTLVVSVKPPPAQVDLTLTTDTFSIHVAPEPPPTTPPVTTTTRPAAKPPKTSKTSPKAKTG